MNFVPGSSNDFNNEDRNGVQVDDCPISELIWSLKYTFLDKDFRSVAEILEAREKKLNLNIEKLKREKELLKENCESEKLARRDIEEELNRLKGKYSDLRQMSSYLSEDEKLACQRNKSSAKRCKLLEVTKAGILEELNKLKEECSDLKQMNSLLTDAKEVTCEGKKSAEERRKLMEVTNAGILEELKKWKDECLVLRQTNARLIEEKKVVSEKEHLAEKRCKKLLDVSKKVEEEDKMIIVELRSKIFELEGQKENAESELKIWKTKFEELGTRVLFLEEQNRLVINKTDENVANDGTGCRGNNFVLEMYAGPSSVSPNVAIGSFQGAGIATERRSPSSTFDSDDYSAPEGTMDGKEKYLLGLAKDTTSVHKGVENGAKMLKRKEGSSQQVDENEIGDDNGVKRHKVFVHGSASTSLLNTDDVSGSNNTERVLIPQRQDAAVLEPCENSWRINIENLTRNLLLDELSDSDDSSSSFGSEDDLSCNFDFSLFLQKREKEEEDKDD